MEIIGSLCNLTAVHSTQARYAIVVLSVRPSVTLMHYANVAEHVSRSFHYLVTTSNVLPQRIRFWQNSDWVVPNGRDRKIRNLRPFPDQNNIWTIEQCNPWPHVANRHISISELLSLWRHSHCDVIRYWACHAHRYGRTLGYVRYVRTPYRV